MATKRRKHSEEFKAKGALEAVKDERGVPGRHDYRNGHRRRGGE